MYLIQACEKAWVHFFRHLPGQDQLLQNAQLFVEQLHAACRVWMPLQLVHPVRLPRQWTLLHLLLRGTGFFAYYRLPCGMTCSRKDNQIRNGRSYGEQGPNLSKLCSPLKLSCFSAINRLLFLYRLNLHRPLFIGVMDEHYFIRFGSRVRVSEYRKIKSLAML